ncbi:MAG: efflux RND transporter permease subunit [Clostridiales bacterium]|nr:efflux RND transporter permease subunit [Clostridiales bacterium]
MSLSKFAVRRPVTAAMLVLIAVAVGILSVFSINLDMMPNMNLPIAVVSTSYSGAGPEEVENLITRPLEGVLGTVPGVSEITSISSYGSSLVMVQFEDNTDINIAALDMRERVDMIKDYLPEGSASPMVLKIDINSMASIQIGITSASEDLIELKRLVEDQIVGRFERQDGVAQVNLTGGREREINIVLNEEALRGYGISEATVSQILMAENRTTPTGEVKQGDKRLTLRVAGEFTSVSEIGDIPFATPRGAVVFLRDFAQISEVLTEPSSLAYINGIPSVQLSIQKQSTANTVNVSDAVLAEVERIRADMPDIGITVLLDPADYIRLALNTVASSAVFGGLLAVAILYVFLRNLRTTLIVAVSIPVSIVSTFALMYYANISLNMMSLGGLALGVGMLVDNSIVVLESIYRKIEEGEGKVSAAIEGAREVAMSVTASTLTTVAVFLPISFAGGLTAQIFNQLSLTICFSLASSLAVSLTFVPMTSSLILKQEIVQNVHKRTNIFTKILDIMGTLINGMENGYKKLLASCLKHKFVTVFVILAFTGATFFSLNFIGQEFMPQTDEGAISIDIDMPRATVIEETQKTAFAAVDLISGNYPEIVDISVNVGGGGGMGMFSIGGGSADSASVTISLTDKTERQRGAAEIAADISRKLADIPGAEITVEAVGQAMGNFGGGGIDINIFGDDYETLSQIANDMRDMLSEISGTREAQTSIQETSPQATIRINRAKASLYGISAYSVSGIISTAVSGTVATTFKEGADEYDIRIRQNQDNFDFITDIQNILIPSPQGVNVPLYEIAEVEITEMPASISRENQSRYVSVSARLSGRDLASVMEELEAKLAGYYMPEGYSWEEAGTAAQMTETFSDLGFALILAVALVYMIMAAQFESLIYPFIVMFSIPIALTGGIFGLFVMGESLSITGYLGFIMLAGVVVNNAIVLVDYTNLLIRERGMGIMEALSTAGPVRMRPILMTTLTTVLALIPMLVTQSTGSELMRGLAVVVVFGLSLSTLVTLLFVPVVYVIVNNVKEFAARGRNKA